MKELIARLEAATEGSRKLDEMIGHAVRTTLEHGTVPPPHYTTSIDAALTLLCDPWTGFLLESPAPDGRSVAMLSRPGTTKDGDDMEGGCVVGKRSRGATPALALCVAALRART